MDERTIRLPTCLNCGTPGTPGEGYCRNCGKPLLQPTIAATPPAGTSPTPPPSPMPPGSSWTPPPAYAAPVPAPARKRRSPFMMGCLVIIGLIFVGAAAGGIYVWRATTYAPPNRTAPDIPETASGTMTEFPVDNDPTAPARPTSVQSESLGGTTAKSSSSSAAKLPPGIDRGALSKGATTMTTSVYKPKPKKADASSSTTSANSIRDEIYICVLKAMPNQPTFVDGLAGSVVQATNGTRTGVSLTSPKGGVYTGSKIRSPQANVYVLNKQGGDIVIIIYSPEPSMQDTVDRLASNVGNAGGLFDYPEVKNSLWTLPATTPPELTMVDFSAITGEQIESSIASGGGDDTQRILSQMRPFIPSRLTNARYMDSSRREWVALNFEYESSFQAWRTWLLARSALGLGGAQSTTVRDVNALYLDQDGQRILVFQKGPYLIFLGAPSGASIDRLVALGNGFQV
jgi:hypothetical protein